MQFGIDGMEAHRGIRLAWLLWTACAMGAVASLGFAAVNGAAQRETGLIEAGGNAGLTLAFGTVGALVAVRHVRNPVGWLLIALGCTFAIHGFAQEYATYVFTSKPDAPWGGETVAWVSAFKGEVTGIGLFALVLLFFPNGRLPSPPWRIVMWIAAAGIGLSMLAAFRPGPFRSASYPPSVTNPLGVPGGDAIFGAAEALGMILMLVAVILAIASAVRRFRHAEGSERRQLEWLVLGAGAVVAFMVGTQLLFKVPRGIEEPLFYLAFAALPTAIGVAILKHDLYDIDLVLSRTLVWGSLTAVIVGTYVVVVGFLGTLVHARGDFIPSLVATGLVALLFQSLRDRVQRLVNRLIYGDRDDPYAVVSRLGWRLEATLAPGAVLPTIVKTVAEALKLPYVAIALRQGQTLSVTAAFGTPGRDLLNLPLMYQSEPVGQLSLAPRAPGDAFTTNDLRLLEDLARQVGIVAHAVRLTGELQRSRERLVTAREEERRRLRRDLHDGVGPSLASITLKLEAARNLLPRDPGAVDALLADLTTQTQAAIADVRRAVYDLRPPALDELGLVSALRAHAARLEGEGPRIVIDAPCPLPALPAAVEVAAYRITLEALTNVIRHAAARTCLVRLLLSGGCLVVELTDDGRGIPADIRAGVGFTAMRERTVELGGTLQIGSTLGSGGRVTARLPLPLTPDDGRLPDER
ncbi:MAG TPA: histidine kinase [Thermomicrobiales bacterium]|nr:histidine kinase [Thermomicrobiales bacterium]